MIDVDLHNRWHSEEDLIAYLPTHWREICDRSRSDVYVEAPVALFHHTSGTNKRLDSHPSTGGPPGSDYATLTEQWLDPYPIERCVLSFDIGTSAGVPNPALASALCTAANDWNVERWLSIDDSRLYAAVLVPTQIPEDGAAEIYRLASNDRIVEALVVSNGLGKPFGHPVYHPIYAAAEECGLPIAIHTGGDQWNAASHQVAGGLPNSRLEFMTLSPTAMLIHLMSFVTHGVFEKFPKLSVLSIEAGFAWLPWFLWSMDSRYAEIRRESPWVKRLPSEYVREHMRFSSQPLELTADRDQLVEALEALGGVEDLLVFASDYPHWDTDDPRFVATRLPKSWWPKLFYENARGLLRWPKDAPQRATEPAATG
jgi:predicted TIM-barrel fold metal-dependent hydrolase